MRSPIRTIFLVFFVLLPVQVLAAELTFRHTHHIFTLNSAQFPQWGTSKEVWMIGDEEVHPAQAWRVDGDELPPLPAEVSRRRMHGFDTAAIGNTLRERIAAKLDREAGSVVIARSATGVTFDGVGYFGRRLDVARAAELTAEALKRGITDIVLPVTEVQPHVVIVDESLRAAGIQEVVTVGESDFGGSPWARMHNIRVGLRRFNGHLIPQGEIFSFNEVLGPVNEAAGYRKELVIQGEKTLPDYGGGLCQVSTTAYRGAWEYGFPIEARKNHSFAVRYYAPQGTDATIYPPYTDVRFKNDSPGALLIQTVFDAPKAYFIFYGTRDQRRADIIGPYTWDLVEPPDDRTEYITEIPPGETRKASERVPGMKAAWFRIVQKEGDSEVVESTYSAYEARPNYTQIGIATVEAGDPLGEHILERRSQRRRE